MVVVNLAGVKATLDLVPDGTYPARLTKFTFGKSKTNNDKASLEFVFDSEAGEEVSGRKAFIELPLTDNSLWRVKRTLVDLGVDPEDLEARINLQEVFEGLLGAEATIRVGHHEYNGSDHNDFFVAARDSWTS